MLTNICRDFLETSIREYIIPAERVAHVQITNNLEHALLVLTKSGYTAIPVLDPQYKLYGLISSPMIMDAILGLQRIEFEKLEELKDQGEFQIQVEIGGEADAAETLPPG